MNKLIYISILAFGVLFVSCQKQDITPVNTDEMLVPSWEDDSDRFGLNDAEQFIGTSESNARGGAESGEGEEPEAEGGENGAGQGGGNDDPPVAGENGGITDPNEDPDGSGKGKGNK